MDAHHLLELLAVGSRRAVEYSELIRKPSLSVGVYTLRAGANDPQQPHTEDEVYYVVSGRGRIEVGSEDGEVSPGSLVFVGARVPHRFHDIGEDLTVLVFFAPAEYANQPMQVE
ncbi:MAG: cupin domain-containing protein [Chloroflexi bacterium]|nr:cupin domain-containing protein [Chloroflexota bacterium]